MSNTRKKGEEKYKPMQKKHTAGDSTLFPTYTAAIARASAPDTGGETVHRDPNGGTSHELTSGFRRARNAGARGGTEGVSARAVEYSELGTGGLELRVILQALLTCSEMVAMVSCLEEGHRRELQSVQAEVQVLAGRFTAEEMVVARLEAQISKLEE